MKKIVLIVFFLNSILSFSQNLTTQEKLIIDNLEKEYYQKIKDYKDSLISNLSKKTEKKLLQEYTSIYNSNIKKHFSDTTRYSRIDLFLLKRDVSKVEDLIKYLYSGDIDAFEKTAYNFPSMKVLDIRPLCLYMAEQSNDAGLYYCIYILTDKNIRKKIKSFDNTTAINLAIWCLLKAHKMGDMNTYIELSSLFEEGVYFPRNIELSKKLHRIYVNHFYGDK